MPKRSEAFIKGKKVAIDVAVRPNETAPALEYFEGLSANDQARFISWFGIMADTAQIGNKQKFHSLEDGIYEFRVGKHRILCFWVRGAGKLILTHGFYKKTNKTPPGELKLAKAIRNEYLA